MNNLEINNVVSNALNMTICFNNNTFLEVNSVAAVTVLPVSFCNVKLSDFPLQLSEVKPKGSLWKPRVKLLLTLV